MKLFYHSKSFRLFLLVCFLKLIFTDESAASTNQANVSNVRFEQMNDRIIINYDLSGETTKEYHVLFSLKKKSDPDFAFVPEHLTGSIGDGIACGENLSVEWNVNDDFPEGLNGGDYYFVGYASEEEETSISPWIWIGAALIVGGIVFLLVNKSKEDTPNEFPSPPGRPN
ncbi:MAG: hypothetical protein HY960_01900 [Ignavibacteriae bacterium]|nr:hypothetical protein [Ignavibacteriota bacterium]